MHARQAARCAFGAVLVVGALAMFGFAAANTDAPCGISPAGVKLPAAAIAIASWATAMVAAAVAYHVARRWPPDQPRLAASLIWPAVGVSLTLPLTLHLPVVVLGYGARAFDAWCVLSLVVVGLPHLALAILAAGRAHALAHGRDARSPWRIYASVVLVSFTAVILVLPPILVALTGLPFVPLLAAMAPLAARERAIAAGTLSLPRAHAWRRLTVREGAPRPGGC